MNVLTVLAWVSLGVIWGSNFIFMKWASDYLSAQQIVLFRVVFGFLPIFLFALLTRSLAIRDLRHVGHFLVMSLLAAIVYYLGFALGTERLPSGIAGAVSGAIPLFSMLAAVAFLADESLNRDRLSGAAIGLLGVVLIARPFASGDDAASLPGVLYMVGGSLSLGLSFVYARRNIVPLKLSPIALTTYQLGVASVLLLLVTPVGGARAILDDHIATAGLIVGLGLLGTGVAYLLYYLIVERMGAVRASTVTYLPPVVALLIGAVFAGESIALREYSAAGLILGGVFLLNRPGPSNASS